MVRPSVRDTDEMETTFIWRGLTLSNISSGKPIFNLYRTDKWVPAKKSRDIQLKTIFPHP